ncbi:hypothetical protein BD626DRAFT_176778 [Schizophyllum amplum]|uniref:Acetyltransferase n=1 Tax=Schizophyllum amplum TaxID=97359 RepID=A0A550C267_9AGAR|nr:hypothetical protein BD626DRAFT_176778 [Auriculariopsis ampla]
MNLEHCISRSERARALYAAQGFEYADDLAPTADGRTPTPSRIHAVEPRTFHLTVVHFRARRLLG